MCPGASRWPPTASCRATASSTSPWHPCKVRPGGSAVGARRGTAPSAGGGGGERRAVHTPAGLAAEGWSPPRGARLRSGCGLEAVALPWGWGVDGWTGTRDSSSARVRDPVSECVSPRPPHGDAGRRTPSAQRSLQPGAPVTVQCTVFKPRASSLSGKRRAGMTSSRFLPSDASPAFQLSSAQAAALSKLRFRV